MSRKQVIALCMGLWAASAPSWALGPGGTLNGSTGGNYYTDDGKLPSGAEVTIQGAIVESQGYPLQWVTLVVSGDEDSRTVLYSPTASLAYALRVPANANVTVTPKGAHLTFTPAGRTYASAKNVSGESYAALRTLATVGGSLKDAASRPIVGASVVNSTGGEGVTDGAGNYAVAYPAGLAFTLTPRLEGWTFTPALRGYAPRSGNLSGQHFTGSTRYVVAGRVADPAGNPLAGMTLALSGGAVRTLRSDATGLYALTLTGALSYTLTPRYTDYTFTPASRTYPALGMNQADQDFTGNPPAPKHVISGTLTSTDGSHLEQLTLVVSGDASLRLRLSIGSPKTTYRLTLLGGGSYTLSTASGWSFGTPATRDYPNLSSDQTAQNFSVTRLDFTLSGTITDVRGQGVPGVTLWNANNKRIVSDEAGRYALPYRAGTDFSVSPTGWGYAFTPSTRYYSGLAEHRGGQDYAAAWMVPVSGKVIEDGGTPLGSVTLVVSGGASKSFTVSSVNPTASYSTNLAAGLDYTLRPRSPWYTFSPEFRVWSPLAGPAGGQDFHTVRLSFTVRGTVADGTGRPVTGVTLRTTRGESAVTDGAGAYALLLPGGVRLTLTAEPPAAGYSFAPASRVVNGLGADLSGQDYLLQARISGAIADEAGLPVGSVTVSLAGGAVKSVVANSTTSSAAFAFDVPVGLDYVLHPVSRWFVFMPVARNVSALAGPVGGQDFSGVRLTYTVSGSVTDAARQPMPEVRLRTSYGGSVVTDAMGRYALPYPGGLTFTIVPERPAYGFAPASRSFTTPTGDLMNQDFVGAPSLAISGTLTTVDGSVFSGAMVMAVGGGQSLVGYASGDVGRSAAYQITGLQPNTTYVVRPQSDFYTFGPFEQSISLLEADRGGVDFSAKPIKGGPIPVDATFQGDGSGGELVLTSPVGVEAVSYEIRWREKTSPVWQTSTVTASPRVHGAPSRRAGDGVVRTPFPAKDAGTYEFQVRSVAGSAASEWSRVKRVVLGTASGALVQQLSNYPNPFDSRQAPTTIVYTLREAARVSATLFDPFGQLVRRWEFGAGHVGGEAGANELSWDGADASGRAVSDGAYLLVVAASAGSASERASRKILVIH